MAGTSTADMVQGWLNSGGTAATPEQASTSATPGSNETWSPASSDDPDTVVRAENSEVDTLLEEGEDTPTDSVEKELAGSEGKPQTSAKEVITVTDESGRRRKIEIDYSNREAIKKAFSMSHGARKWQADRDQALQQVKQMTEKSSAREKDWQTLEQAFQQGPEHLIDLLKGRRGAFAEIVQQHMQRAEFLKRASPEEVQALEARERADKTAQELDKIRKENEEFKKQVSQERDTAEMRALESRVHPVFEKYRFSERLGDPNDEHMFDEMLWNSALKRLEPYEEKGLDLTPELVDREFRNVAQAIRKRIGVQAEKKASRVIDQKKREATENVQSKIKSGYKSDSASKQAADYINSGNLTGLLKNWSTLGGVFNGKK